MFHSNKKNRSGSATVELAICLPVILLLTMGTIELNDSIFLKQTMTSAAHEGALLGTSFNVTESEIINRVDLVMEERCESPYTVSITTQDGSPFDTLEPGKTFTVIVAANPMERSLAINWSQLETRVVGLKP